jgi:fluoroquinolone transport system permease protein
MNKYKLLLASDLRQTAMDPMLMACFLGPIALTLLARFGYPLAAEWSMTAFDLDISSHSAFTQAFLASTIPMLVGTLTGLRVLDDRDEDVIRYFAVTPLARRGYLMYRLLLPSVICLVLSAAFLLLSGLSPFRLESLFALILFGLEAPWFTLLLAAFSANKVEGLAFAKLGGLLIAGPAAASFLPGAWQWLAAWIPSFWAAKPILLGAEGNGLQAAIYIVFGLIVHLFFLTGMLRIFIKRTD